ncbi:acriflavin resistance protein [Gammaproteobacteria bacterium 45_16_T64]|nr:acriflavin resistance protein [Gammaproteobacteria bacterium 45_16_T64]
MAETQPPTGNTSNTQSLIAIFTQHKVAANLLMFLFILCGLWGLKNLNTQFFPQFELDFITVNVTWSGASAEDIEQSVTLPIEQSLSSITQIKTLTSSSLPGHASIVLELLEGTDIEPIVNKVRQKIEVIRNLPAEAERPVVQRVERYSPAAKVLITGPEHLDEISLLARKFETELIQRGIKKINFNGLPEEEIAIEVPSTAIYETGLSLQQIASNIRQNSQNLPAGTATKSEVSKQIRSLEQQRSIIGFETLPVTTDQQGRLLRVNDIATVSRRPQSDQAYLSWNGKPAVEMIIMRSDEEDILQLAEILHQWMDETKNQLPLGVELHPYNERWKSLKERIQLLVNNGTGGLMLVVATLFLFLRARVAFWVTVGIPTSFLATLAILYFIGGSINMISLFALIMALGIIVDDAIVVGEDTLTHVELGESAFSSAVGGAQRMLAPVISSSLTTIAAFLPLALIGGTMGKIIVDLPTIIICVIIASIIECFIILPGHLHHSLKKQKPENPESIRARFDVYFNQFREEVVRPTIERAIQYRGTTITIGISAFILALSMSLTGHLRFTFFPTIQGNELRASVEFHPGIPERNVNSFLTHLEETLAELDAEYDNQMVNIGITYHRRSFFRGGWRAEIANENGALVVDLKIGKRPITNVEFIKKWKEKIVLPSGVSRFAINQRKLGPGGQALGFRLIGSDPLQLKQASLELQEELRKYNGVSNIGDDLPFGQEQLIYTLTPTGRSLGMTTEFMGKQIRAAFDGSVAQIFHEKDNEIEVRVSLPQYEKDQSLALEQLPIVTPSGQIVPLANIVTFESRQGLSQLNHTDKELNIVVGADVDESAGNANEISASLYKSFLPSLKAKYSLTIGADGQAVDQKETLNDMIVGVGLGLTFIYIILAWVFASYSWPLAVMAAIPFGLTGAIFGHFLLGKDLSMFSLMGLFGLSGIVINDSIVLITFYAKLREAGLEAHQAIVDAICARFRAVLLTTLTTVAGLLPILFETSLQAQFLIPMAISIVFGLLYGTFLILFFIPALLMMIENTKRRFGIGS